MEAFMAVELDDDNLPVRENPAESDKKCRRVSKQRARSDSIWVHSQTGYVHAGRIHEN